jgi:hypothetical protein
MNIFLNTDKTPTTSSFSIHHHSPTPTATSRVVHLWFNSTADSYIIPGGELGIGTRTPTSKLDVNGDIEVGSGNEFYFGDPNTDGSWRINRSGNNLVFQRRESGSWVTKDTIKP